MFKDHRRYFNVKGDLGVRLLAMYLLFVVPIVVIAFFFDQEAGERLRQDIMSADLSLGRAIAQETNTTLQNALLAVQELSLYPEVISINMDTLPAVFENFQSARPDINLIYRLDEAGIMKYHYPEGPRSTLYIDFSFREYFQDALHTKDPLISLGRISPTTQEPVATAIMPLWDEEDKFLGVVATNIRLQSFSNTLANIAAENGTDKRFDIMIVDAGGKVIAHPDSQMLLSNIEEITPLIMTEIQAGENRNLIAVNDAEEMLYTIVKIPSVSWAVIIQRPTRIAFAAPTSFHRSVLLVIVVFMGVGLFFWLALSKNVISPLELLASYTRAIGENTFLDGSQLSKLASISNRRDQIGHLVRSFTSMELDIKDRFKELSTLLETSAAVVSSLDPQKVLDQILDQVAHLLNIKMCAVVALDTGKGIFKTQASRGLSKQYAKAIEISPDESASVTMQAIRTGKPVQVGDVELHPPSIDIRERARKEGYRSMTAIPLNTTYAPPAALIIYGIQPKEYTDREINLLVNFANHAAMAIENATLYAKSDARLQEQTRRLEALIQSMEDGLILEDLDGEIIYVNRSAGELIQKLPEKILGEPVDWYFESLHSLAKNEQYPADEIAIQNRSQTRFIRMKEFTVTDPTDTLIGRGQILRDVTKRLELDRMKSSLIATVSHELRTPLAAIKGFATTLLADDVDWDLQSQREFIETISTEADRLSVMVDNLLDMSRIESGNLKLTLQLVRLEDIIQNALNNLHLRSPERVQVDVDPKIPLISVDLQRMGVVFRNLIENALKYSDDGKPVIIRAILNGENNLLVQVQDQGPGIPEDQQQQVFESFYRIDNGLTRKVQGVGLGLAITRGFINAHGGEISIESSDKGTMIAFTIPIEPELEPEHG